MHLLRPCILQCHKCATVPSPRWPHDAFAEEIVLTNSLLSTYSWIMQGGAFVCRPSMLIDLCGELILIRPLHSVVAPCSCIAWQLCIVINVHIISQWQNVELVCNCEFVAEKEELNFKDFRLLIIQACLVCFYSVHRCKRDFLKFLADLVNRETSANFYWPLESFVQESLLTCPPLLRCTLIGTLVTRSNHCYYSYALINAAWFLYRRMLVRSRNSRVSLST